GRRGFRLDHLGDNVRRSGRAAYRRVDFQGALDSGTSRPGSLVSSPLPALADQPGEAPLTGLLALGGRDPVHDHLAVAWRRAFEEGPRGAVGLEETALRRREDRDPLLLVGVHHRFTGGALREGGETGGRHATPLLERLRLRDVNG